MLKTEQVNIRDPFVLTHGGKYYLYGTRSATCWGPADGFDAYVSEDLENWDGPFEIFHRPEGFFADREYWAPECIFRNGMFFLIVTFGAGDRKKGIYALRSGSPLGPFEVFSGRLTPEDWTCIDGHVFVEGSTPWLFFSHSFEDTPDGDMCALPLTEDLRAPAGEPLVLFSAREASWARPVPFAKAEFGMDGDVYFTDGPCVFSPGGGRLYMTWSSWGEQGYAVGAAVSDSGRAAGPWRQIPRPVFPVNGGHGMIFSDRNGQPRFVLHFPNDRFAEHPIFTDLVLDGEELRLRENGM